MPSVTLITATTRDCQMLESVSTVEMKTLEGPHNTSKSSSSSAIRGTRRRVRFAPSLVTVEHFITSPINNALAWYSHDEIQSIRARSISLCETIRWNQVQHYKRDDDNNDDCCCLRGLELILSQERRKNQSLARRTILATQRANPKLLAVVARRCTAWARQEARNTAILDYYQVYCPDQLESYMEQQQRQQQEQEQPSTLSPLALLKHRLQEKAIGSNQQGRNGTSPPTIQLEAIVNSP